MISGIWKAYFQYVSFANQQRKFTRPELNMLICPHLARSTRNMRVKKFLMFIPEKNYFSHKYIIRINAFFSISK